MKYSLVALDAFLGQPTSEIAATHGCSTQEVENTIQDFNSKRAEILKWFFSHGENRDELVKRFEPKPPPPTCSCKTEIEQLLKKVGDVEILAKRELAILQAAIKEQAQALTQLEEDFFTVEDEPEEPEPVSTPTPLPRLTLGQAQSTYTQVVYEDRKQTPRDQFPSSDPRSEAASQNYRVLVQPKVIVEYRKAFNAPDVLEDVQIRKLLQAMYFQGTAEGTGSNYVVRAVNRRDLEGVELSCKKWDIEHTVYITSVRRLASLADV